MLTRFGIKPAEILLPNEGVNMQKWAVIACDQHTSQPEYWQAVENYVENSPSTLRLIYPEVYLGNDDGGRTRAIHRAMDDYLREGVVKNRVNGYVYIERQTPHAQLRRGLLTAIDLEQYDYSPGSASAIRPTEGTIEDRLPPRMRIREGAALELPHVMLLVDDPGKTVIEPFGAQKHTLAKVYDTPLMQGGGRVAGYAVEAEADFQRVENALEKLFSGEGEAPVHFAVGDGNHSLATARACWLKLRESLSARQRENHPARFALCEIVNLHDDGLVFEPIHRVITGVNPAEMLREICEGGLSAKAVGTANAALITADDSVTLPVKLLQPRLDAYLAAHPKAEIDYVHGDDVAINLANKPNTLSLLLPAIDKMLLFPTVRTGGPLPRKSFSMGEACEKRYYIEARKIR